jgi:hypothetical protein
MTEQNVASQTDLIHNKKAASIPQWLRKWLDWELWPASALYAPIGPIWLWHCFRARSFWFYTSSNPTIYFGGYEGESKMDVYAQMPDDCYPQTALVRAGEDFHTAQTRIFAAGFRYPFVVKPDVGRKGILFRKIDDEAQWREYHQLCPIDYVVQALVDFPMELGVFYTRHPSEQKGRITGIVYRELQEVKGDGKSTLRALIEQHPQARLRSEEFFRKHAEKLDWAPALGERCVLSYAINRSRGARLFNFSHEADAALTAVFDRISLHSGGFFWGRFDVKCNSIEELRKGENYTILEYNGAGASPSHMYHCGLSLWQAWGVILYHWRLLYDISRWNHLNGHPHWSFWYGLRNFRAVRRHLKLLDRYD